MKKLVALVLAVGFLILPMTAEAVVHVNGYFRSNGTYVAPHYRSDPNSSVYDNWSYKGNINPYTGAVGTRTYSGYSGYYSGYTSSDKLSKREKKVVACQATGKTEAYCKSLYMKKKKK